MRELRVALAASALVLTAACGSDEEPEPAASPAPDAAPSAFPVTISNALGDVVVEQEPERVVAIGLSELDTLLALGVVPVAYGTYGAPELYDYQAEGLDGAPEPEAFDLSDGIPLETIAAYQPDLIVNLSWGEESDYRKLNQIAPVVSWVQGAFADPWQTQVSQIAPALGLADEGAEAVATTEAALGDLDGGEVLDGRLVTYAAADDTGACVVDGPTSPSIELFRDLGLEPNPAFLDAETLYCREVSLENIDELESDLLVVLASAEQQATLLDFSIFADLDVARDGRVVWLDPDASMANIVNSPTLLGLPHLLDELGPELVAMLS